MTPTLVPCPLCGAENGYTLGEGETYRWRSVKCAGCGQEVTQARATYPAETTPRTARADEAWNQAGAYANGLREQIAAARAQALEDAARVAMTECGPIRDQLARGITSNGEV